MALEYLSLRTRPSFYKRIQLPIFFGLFVAILTARGCHSTIETFGKEDPTAEILTNVIGGFLVGLALGLLGHYLAKLRVREIYLARVKTAPNAAFPSRTFSWDETGVGIASPLWRFEWIWPAVDDIWEGAIAIHFVWKGELLFSVPKSALPAEAHPEKLRVMMRNYSPKPPRLTTTS